MELEALHGFVVRRAAQHGLAVPMSEAVYACPAPLRMALWGGGSVI